MIEALLTALKIDRQPLAQIHVVVDCAAPGTGLAQELPAMCPQASVYSLPDPLQAQPAAGEPFPAGSTALAALCARHGVRRIDVLGLPLDTHSPAGALVTMATLQHCQAQLEHCRYLWLPVAAPLDFAAALPLLQGLQSWLAAQQFERITPCDAAGAAAGLVFRNARFFERLEPSVVLGQVWGGLGDNLQLTTLPELYARQGVHCYLAADNLTRNNEIRDLVWGDNPFLRGAVNAPPGAGQGVIESRLATVSLHEPYMARIALAHGLPGRHRAPEVFRPPRKIAALQGKTLLDLSSTSVTGGAEKLTRYVQAVLTGYQYPLDDVLQVRFLQYTSPNALAFSNLQNFDCENLAHYWDALHSVRRLITVHSGIQSLAVAARDLPGASLEDIHVYATPFQFNTRMYIYDRIQYHIE